MNTIRIERYTLGETGDTSVDEIARCYRSVFAGAPWNEFLKCPVCNKRWGVTEVEELQKAQFQHCGVLVEEFWPLGAVSADIRKELSRESSCWIAKDERVIGFCWGYESDLAELEHNLGISFDRSICGIGKDDPVAYQDEIGVLSEYRRHGIAREMFARRLDDFLDKGLGVGVVRTRAKPHPSVTFAWYQDLGYRIIAEYPDGRVILARELSGLRERMRKKQPSCA